VSDVLAILLPQRTTNPDQNHSPPTVGSLFGGQHSQHYYHVALHNQNDNIQAQLIACYQENTHLKGQKEMVQQELGAIQHDVLVRQTILELINLTNETKQPCLPSFQTLPLKEVAARLAISAWDDIDSLSFNATHCTTMVCNVLVLVRNGECILLWTAPSNRAVWFRLFGSEPKVQTGRITLPSICSTACRHHAYVYRPPLEA
jgi:hypothetical protein